MLRISFLVAVIFLMAGLLYSCNQTKKESELSTLIKEGAILIDVRNSDEFAEGSVPGAINIPVDLLQDNIEELKTNKPIIVFCKSGNRAEKAKKMLEKNNITDVTNGGSWQNVKTAWEKNEAEVQSANEIEK